MQLEVLLSEMNLDKSNLINKKITTKCVVINQCDKKAYEKYKNFRIFSYNEKGVSNSRNKAIENSSGDILLFADDDVVYYDNYEKKIISEFKKNKKADLIFFNLDSQNKESKLNIKNKRIHFYNCLRYGTVRIAIKRESLVKSKIKFNCMFGGNSCYSNGEDTLFVVDCLRNGLNLYTSKETIGIVNYKKSTWFNGYNEQYFFDKGALFCAISKNFCRLLCFQYLIRHKYVLNNTKLSKALKLMTEGSKSYIKGETYNDKYNCNSI